MKATANSKLARLKHSNKFNKLVVKECGSLKTNPRPNLQFVRSNKFSEYRNEDLVQIKSPSWTTIINAHKKKCESFVNPSLGKKKDCIAVVHADTRSAHQLLRYDTASKWKGLVTKSKQYFPTGFFRRTGNQKGRGRVAEKMAPLFIQLKDVEALLSYKLEKQGIQRGDDVVVMVTNPGEMDLFMNFACSCRFHNMTMHNVIVFTSSRYYIILFYKLY